MVTWWIVAFLCRISWQKWSEYLDEQQNEPLIARHGIKEHCSNLSEGQLDSIGQGFGRSSGFTWSRICTCNVNCHLVEWIKMYFQIIEHWPKRPLSTMLATSKNVLFPCHNYHANHQYGWLDTLIITLAGDHAVIEVSGYPHQWLAGGCDLEKGHFFRSG